MLTSRLTALWSTLKLILPMTMGILIRVSTLLTRCSYTAKLWLFLGTTTLRGVPTRTRKVLVLRTLMVCPVPLSERRVLTPVNTRLPGPIPWTIEKSLSMSGLPKVVSMELEVTVKLATPVIVVRLVPTRPACLSLLATLPTQKGVVRSTLVTLARRETLVIPRPGTERRMKCTPLKLERLVGRHRPLVRLMRRLPSPELSATWTSSLT